MILHYTLDKMLFTYFYQVVIGCYSSAILSAQQHRLHKMAAMKVTIVTRNEISLILIFSLIMKNNK